MEVEIPQEEARTPVERVIRFCLQNRLVVFLLLLMFVGWGILVAPFDWDLRGVERNPVPVDAIPDIGENQQIVFTDWMGRSPQDVEDQITYPLTVAMLGIPGVKSIRSFSMFGFSTIYIIFNENVEFYWSRSRILEKLNSLPSGTLPPSVQPALGPDATALGQVFWYTLEGQDEHGNPTGGWDLNELRSIQDWYVRYGLTSTEGVSEVASVGGFVQEYQVDVDPDAMRAYGVGLQEVFNAVKMSNVDVGARTMEINKVEYVIRGLGFIKDINDIERSVIKETEGVPITVEQVARVSIGPALRRGALDKEGAEVVGGVVVVRYGDNPLAAIQKVKEKIREISPGLPQKTLSDGTVSQVRIVPFYDRTGLIYETLGTLNTALIEEILVTIVVVLLLIQHFRSSILISGMLPLAVLLCFVAMKLFGVDANVVALSGIAIAIGTMVDNGVVICENILRHFEKSGPDENRLTIIYRSTREVGGAVLTAVLTTIVGFLPVFSMIGPEGKLFKPLAFTKTFALAASIIVALTILPSAAYYLYPRRKQIKSYRPLIRFLLYFPAIGIGVAAAFTVAWWAGTIIVVLCINGLLRPYLRDSWNRWLSRSVNWIVAFVVILVLSSYWLPLGPALGLMRNVIFVAGMVGGLIFLFYLFQRSYESILGWCLKHKKTFLSLVLLLTCLGGVAWLGFETFFGWLPEPVRDTRLVQAVEKRLPGLGKEFMPPLDEGSFLFMPTTMPHASIGETLDVLQKQDRAIQMIPEVESVVGKLGRVESALDPAPISMFETVINYKSEFLADQSGRQQRFRYHRDESDWFRDERGDPAPAPDGKPYRAPGRFERDENNRLIPDSDGVPFRLWRPALDPDLNPDRKYWPGIRNPDHIWDEIVRAAEIPGVTMPPMLQPIATRIVMLQTGMRAPMGIKVRGPDLNSIERVGLQLEQYLKEVPSIEPTTVLADRIVGKPYLEIDIDRTAISRYGIMLQQVQDVIEVAVGGKRITTTVEGRERYPVRVRYLRELRDTMESLGRILVPAPGGSQIPLIQLARIRYVRGPQVIKSEDTFLIGYVTFDKKPEYAEVDVVEEAQTYLGEKMASGELVLPAGVSFAFAGSYENQVRAQKKMAVILPLALLVIFIILYMQFKSVSTTLLVFFGIFVAWSGGFIMVWLYGQSWFMNFSVFDVSMRDLFQMHTINLSVAVWVGFLALFGIASDNGVLVATVLDETFAGRNVSTVQEAREATMEAAQRRIRPALMTTATTILALIPVLTSAGRGADIMVPMAIPSFGGMLIALITVMIVPVLYCALKERKLKKSLRKQQVS